MLQVAFPSIMQKIHLAKRLPGYRSIFIGNHWCQQKNVILIFTYSAAVGIHLQVAVRYHWQHRIRIMGLENKAMFDHSNSFWNILQSLSQGSEQIGKCIQLQEKAWHQLFYQERSAMFWRNSTQTVVWQKWLREQLH